MISVSAVCSGQYLNVVAAGRVAETGSGAISASRVQGKRLERSSNFAVNR